MPLEELKALTDKLPPHLSIYAQQVGPGMVMYDAEAGHIVGGSIFRSREVACQVSFRTKDSVLGTHVHSSHEFILVVIGCLEFYLPNEVKRVGETEAIQIGPGVEHHVLALEHTLAISATMPPVEGYP